MTESKGAGAQRILIVSFLEPWSMGPGKGAPSLYETLAGYARAGFAVDYVTFHKRTVVGTAHEVSVDPEIDGVKTHRFSMPHWKFLPPALQAKLDRLILFPILSAFIIRRLLRQRQHEILYAYEISAIIGSRLARLFLPKKFKIVHRIQGVSLLRSSHHNLWLMLRKLEWLLALKMRADAYIMTNDGTLGDVVWKYWNRDVDGERLFHARNGLSASMLVPRLDRAEALRSLGLDPSNIYLLMLSRLDPIKRVERGLHALADMENAKQVRLLIAGDGEELEPLKALAEKLGIADRVIFLGGVERSDVARVMSAADMFVSTYDFSNCGNPLFEAQWFELPVVTLDNGATGTVISDGVNGLLLPVGDHARLVQALSLLVHDRDLRARLSAGAKTWADENMVSWQLRMEREVEWLSHVPQR